LDAYVVLNLSPLKLSNWQLSVDRQSHSWGPGPGGAFLLSDNAEPIGMVDIVNPEPIRLPFLLKFLGPARIDQFVGMLEGRTDHAHPLGLRPKNHLQAFALPGDRIRAHHYNWRPGWGPIHFAQFHSQPFWSSES
jgi:hypothetical protein